MSASQTNIKPSLEDLVREVGKSATRNSPYPMEITVQPKLQVVTPESKSVPMKAGGGKLAKAFKEAIGKSAAVGGAIGEEIILPSELEERELGLGLIVTAQPQTVEIYTLEAKGSTINGAFVTLPTNWARIKKHMTDLSYKIIKQERIEEVSSQLGIGKVVPPSKFWRDFSKKPDVHCQAELTLTVDLLFGDEVRTKADKFFQERISETNATTDSTLIKDWIATVEKGKENEKENEKRRGNEKTQGNKKPYFGTYNFITFKIGCTYSEEFTEKDSNMMPEGESEEIRQIVDTVSERLVFSDFLNAFKDVEKSPIIHYAPKKMPLDFKIELEQPDQKVKLGEKIKAKLSCTTPKEKVPLGSGEKIKLNLEADKTYFRIQETHPNFPDIFFDHDKETTAPIIIEPLVDVILKEDQKPSYPLKIKVIEDASGATLSIVSLNIQIENPALRIETERTRLPSTGGEVAVTINFTFENCENLIDEITLPINVEVSLSPDFKAVKPVADTNGEIKETINLINTKSSNNKHAEPATRTYYLTPLRAGIVGYLDRAYFNVTIGKWSCPILTWEMKMNVLPNWFDMMVAALTGFAGLITIFYPSIIPPLTASPTIATLTSSGAVVYLGFRVITWGLTTRKSNQT